MSKGASLRETGSHPSDQAPAGLGPSGFDPARCRNCGGDGWTCENHRDRPWGGTSSDAAACECGAGAPCPVCEPEMTYAEGLWEAIKHGDDDHKAWLREALHSYFAGKPVPAPRGSGNKEARIAELERQLAIAAAARSGETNEDLARSEGCQSGPSDSEGNAQSSHPQQQSEDNH